MVFLWAPGIGLWPNHGHVSSNVAFVWAPELGLCHENWHVSSNAYFYGPDVIQNISGLDGMINIYGKKHIAGLIGLINIYGKKYIYRGISRDIFYFSRLSNKMTGLFY